MLPFFPFGKTLDPFTPGSVGPLYRPLMGDNSSQTFIQKILDVADDTRYSLRETEGFLPAIKFAFDTLFVSPFSLDSMLFLSLEILRFLFTRVRIDKKLLLVNVESIADCL